MYSLGRVPGDAKYLPEQEHEWLEDVPKVVVPLDGGCGVHLEGPEQLHPNDGVDEKQHAHQHTNIGKRL